MKAMIFAAGLGTRLKPFTDTAPKALVKVGNTTLLEHSIKYLQQYGIFDVIVNIHHYGEMIIKILESNNGFGSQVTISDERSEILETGGGLKKTSWYFNDDPAFVALNVDILTDLDLSKMIDAHANGNTVATLAVMKRNSNRQFLFNEKMQLCGWKNEATGQERISKESAVKDPFSFSGIQITSNEIWNNAPFDGKFSLVDLYLHVAQNNVINGYDHSGDKLIDVGKPGSIEKATELFF